MRPVRSISIDDVFNDALALDPSRRAEFLDRACEGDGELRREVESLLAAHEGAEDFLDLPGDGCVGSNPERWPQGTRVGPYQLERLLGVGGMGAVWEASRADNQYTQRVAIKFIRRDVATALARARFRRERQVLADLEHPGITRLIDGGATSEGLPYLVMELVVGVPIDRHCDEAGLGIDGRIELFREACEAVRFAHQRLVIHRDIKPANVLVTPDGRVKLLDFGVSRLLDAGAADGEGHGLLTALTPRYASPEQLTGGPVTTASDVYSLGVVLHELLTGALPTDGLPKPSEVAAMSATAPPDRAARVRRLRGDLDSIILKAIEPNIERRYASVDQLLDDLRREVAGLPVTARPATRAYRLAKFARRHRAGVIAASVAVATLISGLVISLAALVKVREAERVATAERRSALSAMERSERASEFLRELIGSANPYRHGGRRTLVDVLDEAAARVDVELGRQPEVAAEIHLTLGRSYASIWHWPKALRHAEAALELRRHLQTGEDLIIADCLALYGRALTWRRDPRSADIQRQALAIRRRLLSPEDPLIAESMVLLAFAEWSAARPPAWESAERGYRDALAMYARSLPGPDARVGVARMSLGAMLLARGRTDDAEQCLAESLEVFRALPARQDRYYWAALNMYAMMLHDQHRLEEEEPILAELFSVTPDGFETLEYAEAIWRLGEVRFARGDHAAAVESFREAMLWRYRVLARDSERLRRYEEAAEALLQRCSDGAEAMSPRKLLTIISSENAEEAAWWADRMARFGHALIAAGDTEGAREWKTVATQALR